jgi:GTPase SAR1 family protein
MNKNEPKILILGLDCSGKSTILMKLKDFKVNKINKISIISIISIIK